MLTSSIATKRKLVIEKFTSFQPFLLAQIKGLKFTYSFCHKLYIRIPKFLYKVKYFLKWSLEYVFYRMCHTTLVNKIENSCLKFLRGSCRFYGDSKFISGQEDRSTPSDSKSKPFDART